MYYRISLFIFYIIHCYTQPSARSAVSCLMLREESSLHHLLYFPFPVVSIRLNYFLLLLRVVFVYFAETYFIFQILDSLNEVDHHCLYFYNFISQLSNCTYIYIYSIYLKVYWQIIYLMKGKERIKQCYCLYRPCFH